MIKAVIWIPLFKYNPDSITWMAYAQQQAKKAVLRVTRRAAFLHNRRLSLFSAVQWMGNVIEYSCFGPRPDRGS